MKRLQSPSLDLKVDPVLGIVAGAVLVLGGGAAAYGASRDTAVRTPAPAEAPQADAVVARALQIVERVDGTVPAGDVAAARDEARRAAAASARGRSVDPFPDVKPAADAASTASAGTGVATNVPSPQAQASAAAATVGSSGSTSGGAGRAGSTTTTPKADTSEPRTTTPEEPDTAAPPTIESTERTPSSGARARAAARRRLASAPAKVTLRVVTPERRATMNRRAVGLLVPERSGSVARVVRVSRSNRVVTLRLREGAALAGKQSPGTRCVQRRAGSSSCLLIHVRTGRTAVIRAPRGTAQRPAAVTALRVLSVWRAGTKVAD